MTFANPIDTFNIDGRDYIAFRVGPRDHSGWNLIGIAPQSTQPELDLADSKRPRLPCAYGSPVAPARGWVGHPDAPITEGWRVMDEMNRTTFGYATTIPEIARIAAAALKLPAR